MFSIFMIALVIGLFFLEKYLARRAGGGSRPAVRGVASRVSAPKRK